MAAIITDQIRILNAGNFVAGVSNASNSYYSFIGLPNPTDYQTDWDNSPPAPKDNFDQENDWILDLNNFFLIRKPELVVPSFLLKFPEGDFEDLGFKQQIDIFNYIKNQTKKTPVVVDATDIRNNPTKLMPKLCKKLTIKWDDSMLTWKPGLKEYDGVWAKHWYHSVEKSNSFKPEETSKATLSNRAKQLVEQANIYYQQIPKYKI